MCVVGRMLPFAGSMVTARNAEAIGRGRSDH